MSLKKGTTTISGLGSEGFSPSASVSKSGITTTITITDKNGTTTSQIVDENIQYSTIPTAGADTVGKVVQYIGTTDSNYTNGYFYKGISTTNGNQTIYDWEQVNVQDNITLDNTPTENSTNGVTSGGVFEALAGAGGGLDYTILNDWEGYINIATCKPIIYIPKDVGSNSTFRVYIDENRTYAKSYDLSYMSSSYVQLISITKIKEIDWNSSASGKNVFAYVDYYHMKDGRFRRDYYYRLNSEKTARIEDVTLVNGLLSKYVPSTISEKYTFDTLPETSVTPTTDNQFVNKSYVDAQIQALRNELSGGA